MSDLPLFPLNTVLYPGMPLHLHIFEERYKVMMAHVMQSNKVFGVALIQHGAEALGPLAEPYSVGCLAKVVSTQPVGQGRLNILSVGQDRFRIRSLDHASQPYLTAKIESCPLQVPPPDQLQAAADRLRPWLERYLKRLAELGEMQRAMQDPPEEPVALLYVAAILLQVPMPEKQSFLEAPGALELAEQLHSAYRRELGLLEALMDPRSHTQTRGGFSRN